jgi:hypothetical protein
MGAVKPVWDARRDLHDWQSGRTPILGYRLTASVPACDQLLTFGIARVVRTTAASLHRLVTAVEYQDGPEPF